MLFVIIHGFREELERSRKKVAEIHHFLDLQREEFVDFHIFALDIQVSAASEDTAAEDTLVLSAEEHDKVLDTSSPPSDSQLDQKEDEDDNEEDEDNNEEDEDNKEKDND